MIKQRPGQNLPPTSAVSQAALTCPVLLSYAEQVKKLGTISNMVSALFYIIHGHLENFFRLTLATDAEGRPAATSAERLLGEVFKAFSALAEDAEQIMTNLIRGIGELREYMNKHWPKDGPTYLTLPGVTEGEKWQNFQKALTALRTSGKVIAHRKKIAMVVKNCVMASKVCRALERRDHPFILV